MKAEVNNEGLVKCEICGKFFNRVACHVNKAHNMNAKQYREFIGYSSNECLSSEKSLQKTALDSWWRYHSSKMRDFMEKSKATRFVRGECGRMRQLNTNQ